MSKGRWMGFGDAKLALGLGFLLGWPLGLFNILFSFWMGAIIGVALLLLSKKSMKSQIPFGPFLAVSAFLVFMMSDYLMNLIELL